VQLLCAAQLLCARHCAENAEPAARGGVLEVVAPPTPPMNESGKLHGFVQQTCKHTFTHEQHSGWQQNGLQLQDHQIAVSPH
jgi:hypothetical protein